MKNETNKFLKAFLITVTTLAIGYAVTMLSFNLFGELTIQQMRGIFLADMLAFMLTGAGAFLLFENKKIAAQKEKQFEARHTARIERAKRNNEEISKIIFQSNKVA